MPKPRPKKSSPLRKPKSLVQPTNHFITLWSLRVFLQLGVFDRFVDRHGGFENLEILQSIGLEEYYEDPSLERSPARKAAVQKQLQARLKTLQTDSHTTANHEVFSRSVGLLKKSLSLSRADIELLRFAITAPQSQGLNYLLEILGDMNFTQTKHAMAVILAVPVGEINQALNPNSLLLTAGLLGLSSGEGHITKLHNRFDLPEGIKQALSTDHKNDTALLRCFFRASPKARLRRADFAHVQQDFDLIRAYLQAVFVKKTRGVNILIYGDPGTGKTEMVRALCASGAFSLFEITMQNAHGVPLSGADRFATLQLAQKLLAQKEHGVLLFDEIEDVFPNAEFNLFGQAIVTHNKKAWINHLLEDNPIPTVWISNTVQQIDPSYLRRFDYVLKLRPLSHAVRLRIIKKYLRHLPVSAGWVSRLAEQEHLVPAMVERAAKVADHLTHDNPAQLEHTLESLIGNTLEVMGLPKHPHTRAPHVLTYRLDYLNPDVDLDTLCTGLARQRGARLCLYGPPGTGKTAFAHYLAARLERPVVIKRASDILSKWVGEAEQNIANLFHQAAHEDQIIVLDEADSFLQERAGARQSWEITQVNELLVQMETFQGIFIASTNLMDSLDAASLRRFDFKIKFDYLLPEQAWAMFVDALAPQSITTVAERTQYQSGLRTLNTLTPGDYATVLRQTQRLGLPLTPTRLLEGLIKECQAKPNYRRTIGFV